MIEYDRERNAYILYFSDKQSDVKGWVQEVNGLVFMGLNDAYADEWPDVMAKLFAENNTELRKSFPIFDLRWLPSDTQKSSPSH